MSRVRRSRRLPLVVALAVVLAVGLAYLVTVLLLGPGRSKPARFVAGEAEPTLPVPAGKAIAELWQRPADLPARGTLSVANIPGTTSGFTARDAYVWLPPAYAAKQRPLLPVVILMSGEPGSPEDWVDAGGLERTMNDFATAHQGLAPVVVVVDPLGAVDGNTLCMDSRIARVQTYLAEDVPAWIHQQLQVGSGRRAWTAAGLSFGGTCSLQLAVNFPEVYGSFLDIAGQDEPTLGSHAETVEQAFGGDEAAFAALNALSVMSRKKFPDTAGVLVAGTTDEEFTPQQQRVFVATRQAGMDVALVTLPGGHDWGVWRPALERELPWIARRDGLIPA